MGRQNGHQILIKSKVHFFDSNHLSNLTFHSTQHIFASQDRDWKNDCKNSRILNSEYGLGNTATNSPTVLAHTREESESCLTVRISKVSFGELGPGDSFIPIFYRICKVVGISTVKLSKLQNPNKTTPEPNRDRPYAGLGG